MILPLVMACLAGCTGFTPAKPSSTLGSRSATPGTATLQIVTNALPVGTVQSRYSAKLIATGGIPPYSWAQTGGQLPSGLTLNSTTGFIAGTVATAGTFTFITKVEDSGASSKSAGFSLNISAALKAPTNAAASSIAITAPSNGVTVSGSVSISAAAIDPQSTVAFVQFYLGRSPLGPALTSSPYTVVWDTTQVADGSQSLSATATDVGGNIMLAAIAVTVRNSSWNPAVLGVPWAADFTSIAGNEIDVKMDPRLKVKAAGDGVTDDTPTINAAIQLASSSGGGAVYFPPGDYKIITPSNPVKGVPLVVPSRVILRGSSSANSRIFVNDPNAASQTDGIWTWGGIQFQGASLSGMTDLGVYAVDASNSPCALLWNRGSAKASELFFNNLDVHLGNCKSFWFESTDRLLVQASHFASNSLQYGPIYVAGNSNVSFLGNTIHYNFSRVHMIYDTNLLMQGNTLIRDAQNKDMQDGTAIESGGVELSFGQNVQVLNNTIETLNAPPDETDDGEAIMTQQSNVQNVLDEGSATGITSNTLTDVNAVWGSVTALRMSKFPEVVAILTGSGAGQWRSIQGINTSTKTLTLGQPWSPMPDVGSMYSIFVWTFMNATIQGNTLANNPNGIVLWDGCYNCTVQNNTLTDSRGILLRTSEAPLDPSVYPEGRRTHGLAINAKILNNTVSNTLGLRPAYISLDTEAFDTSGYKGMGMLNVQVGGNTVRPYSGNPSQAYSVLKVEITQEGIFPCFLFGPAPTKPPVTTVFQNINFWSNSQGVAINYAPNFMPHTTQACVTPSAPQ